MNPRDEKPPLSLRVKNRRLLLLLLSVIAGLITLSVVLVAFVFPRRHGRIPRNAREAVLGIQQPRVDSAPISAPTSVAGSAPTASSTPGSEPAP